MSKKQKMLLLRILLAALLLLPALRVDGPLPLRLSLFLLPYAVAGGDILYKAVRGVLRRQVFDENFLMAAATVGAFAVGEYAEGVLVVLLYQLGEWFQRYAVGRSRRSIGRLMDIRPDHATLERDGALVRVDPETVAVGSVIVVQPGERIPLDGVVVSGESALDTAALTGESLPRSVQVGDSVCSGCICMTGVLRVRTTCAYGASTVARILELVENAASRKARSENFIARFAAYYTPAVCALALALGVLPPLVRLLLGLPAEAGVWIYRALTFLVISCPCALVISIPLTFFAGIGGASRAGVLVKGANCLETLAKTRIIAFDKTGTLTQGAFSVAGVQASALPEDTLLDLAAHAECASTHPLARSLCNAYGRRMDRSRVADIFEKGGSGVTALVDGRRVAVGSEQLLKELGVNVPPCTEGGTMVHVAVDGAYAGCIRLADQIKPTAQAAVARLHRLGVRQTVMLTGDRRDAAERTAAELGIRRVYAQLLPLEKVEKVETLLAQKEKNACLAFVGDGVNDAPVLSRADVGIAMGAWGSDAAIEAADVVLMDDDPMKLADAIGIARRCMRIVYENIVLALGVKGVCLLLGALGAAGMGAAIFADVGVMVLAVLNAIRALKKKGGAG